MVGQTHDERTDRPTDGQTRLPVEPLSAFETEKKKGSEPEATISLKARGQGCKCARTYRS